MVIPQPMALVQQPGPSDDWDWSMELSMIAFALGCRAVEAVQLFNGCERSSGNAQSIGTTGCDES
jgi:hypothetical protein